MLLPIANVTPFDGTCLEVVVETMLTVPMCSSPTMLTNYYAPPSICVMFWREKKLSVSLSAKFWVANSCLAISSNLECIITKRIARLKNVCSPDGVHFTVDGYCNIAKHIRCVVTLLQNLKSFSDIQDGCRRTKVSP